MKRARRQIDRARAAHAGKAEPAATRSAPVAATGWRLWLFRLLTLVLPPILFLVVIEAGLRLGGYGYPTGFLVKIPTQDAYTTNPTFGLRFFPRTLARTPQPCYLPARKPVGTYRIFVLGSSAALGIPKPAYGFSRALEVMLDETFPDTEFEVINAAMTAINSNVALPIARDCARHDPDLFVIYMGNNEVIGPYGPGTIFEGFSPSLSLIRIGIWFRTTRTGQLLTDVVRRFHGGRENPRTWGGMQMFLQNPIAADNPRLVGVYSHFRANLTDICHVAERSGAGTILCTVASNLRDCPPFASVDRKGMTPADQARWQALYDRGVARESSGDLSAATEIYRQAAEIDPDFADLQFRLGRCLWGLDRFSESQEHYLRAREWDALRFRADAAINRAIRAVGAREKDRGVHLVDADSSFITSDRTLHGTPGRELFFEHVHPNWDGTYLLAAVVFRHVIPLLPDRIRRRAGPEVAPPSPARCAELLALTDRDRFAIAYQINAMMNNPPFTNQIDHERSRELRAMELEKLKTALTPDALRQANQAHVEAVARKPTDLYFREALAEFAYDSGEYAQAAQQWRALLQRCPGVPKWRLELGRSLSDMGRSSEAVATFRELVHEPLASVEALNGLGLALDREGRTEEAMVQYRRAIESDPHCVEPRYNLGVALARQGHAQQALQEYSRVLDADSSFVDAYIGIGNILERQGKLDLAIEQYRRALRANPVALSAAKLLGVALAHQNRLGEAIQQFTNVVRLDPHVGDAYVNLGSALAQAGRAEEALAAYRSALQVDPNLPGAHYGLGAVLADTGRDGVAAAEHLREAIRLAGDWVLALNRLAELLATDRDPRVRRPAEAVALSEKACRLTGRGDPMSLQTLALAYAASGQFDNAVATGDRARKLAEQEGDRALAARLDQQLALYRQGKTLAQ